MRIFKGNVSQDEKLQLIKKLFTKDIIYRHEKFRKITEHVFKFLYDIGICNDGHWGGLIQDTLKAVENHNRVVVYFNVDDSDVNAKQTVAISSIDNMQWKEAVGGMDENENGLCIVFAYSDEDIHVWDFMSERKIRRYTKDFIKSLRSTLEN